MKKLFNYAEYVLVPAYLVALAWIAASYGGDVDASAAFAMIVAFCLGYGLWTLAEYWTHRVVLHGWKRRAHWVHHLRPEEYQPEPTISTTASIAVVAALFCISAAGAQIGSLFAAGFVSGYGVYYLLHDLIHRAPRFVKSSIIDLHDVHHDSGDEVNFGVQTMVWDRIFGTFRAPNLRRV